MLSAVLLLARHSLYDDLKRSHSSHDRVQPERHIQWIDDNARPLSQRFSAVLQESFQHICDGDSPPSEMAAFAPSLEQLAQMDPSQLQERVELAKALHRVLQTVAKLLPSLDAGICALLGVGRIQPMQNPLHPQHFLNALQSLWVSMAVPAAICALCIRHLEPVWGKSLTTLYSALMHNLHRHGILATGTSALPPARSFATPPVPSRSGSRKDSFLTLERLRGLLARELDTVQAIPCEGDVSLASFDAQFSREFESGYAPDAVASSDDAPQASFAATQPSAFVSTRPSSLALFTDAVGTEQRPAIPGGTAPSLRQQLQGRCRTLGQQISLDVVALMVDELVHDLRLLEPVRRVIEDLLPALMHLALADLRFWSDRQNPACKLLLEITQRGLAFRSTNEVEFGTFLMALHRNITPLIGQPVSNVQPFDLALSRLKTLWQDLPEQTGQISHVVNAVQALQRAEERNLLAEQMVAAMELMPEMQQVPSDVAEFLCGPWAQVMAFAEINSDGSTEDPGQYKDLVNALLWSAQPDLTRQNVATLTKLVPRLLSRLRRGLGLIDYPSVKTSLFFDVLMKLHQQAFQPPETSSTQHHPVPSGSQFGNQDHWVAPTEVKASGFMDLPDDADTPQSPGPHATASDAESPHTYGPQPLETLVCNTPGVSLVVGAWVELQHKNVWRRTQLTWISPKGTMYLFANVLGQTQSMTQRSLNKMLATGTLRVVCGQPMLDSALDAVTQQALQNSLSDR